MSEKTIKSVRRVFEILELFDSSRRPLSAKEISDRLGYPLASAHALMKSMHELGYADFDSPKWTYLPSRKFCQLAEWLHEYLDRETQLLKCMEALNQETRETINLSRLVGPNVKIIHGLESAHTVGVSVKVGTLMPATESLTGITALAALSEEDLKAHLGHFCGKSAKRADSKERRLIDEVRRELESFGSVARGDLFIQGIGAVCVPVETQYSNESMVIGVVGPSDRISRNEDEHRAALHSALSEFKVKSGFASGGKRKTA